MSRLLIAAVVALAPCVASAEVELSFYTGIQESPHSKVTGTETATDGGGDLNFTAGWEGKSFAPPPYYGVRGTWWQTDRFGFGAEFTHDKVYADDQTKTDNGYTVLEFTDGLNIITVNGLYRWPSQWGSVTPYVGGGLGIAVPHVEVERGSVNIRGYQLTGPAVRWMAGASYALTDQWSLFGEYQGTYSKNSVDLGDGGELNTNIITNAVNLGVSFSF